MVEYRFKSREEFITEYGIHWDSKIKFGWYAPWMDILYGKNVFDYMYTVKLKELLENNKLIFNIDHNKTVLLSKDMIVKKPSLPNYKPKLIKRQL